MKLQRNPAEDAEDLLDGCDGRDVPVAEGPFDDKPDVRSTLLTGDHAIAYERFAFAAGSLQEATQALQAAQDKYREALARLSTLAAGTAAPPDA